jgi:PTH1 family peptidyl-tRNA hydrolase
MKSLISVLGTEKFPRMRIGIGRSQHSVNHVLGKFHGAEKDTITATLEQTLQAVYTWIHQDINAAMNKFNI